MKNLKRTLDISGFNPNTKQGFGSGLMCGILFVFDLPFMILSTIWNFFSKTYVKSIGVISFKDVYNKSTLGGIIGFVLAGVGIGGYFNQSNIFGDISYQKLWIIISCIFMMINIAAAIYTRKNIAK